MSSGIGRPEWPLQPLSPCLHHSHSLTLFPSLFLSLSLSLSLSLTGLSLAQVHFSCVLLHTLSLILSSCSSLYPHAQTHTNTHTHKHTHTYIHKQHVCKQ